MSKKKYKREQCCLEQGKGRDETAQVFQFIIGEIREERMELLQGLVQNRRKEGEWDETAQAKLSIIGQGEMDGMELLQTQFRIGNIGEMRQNYSRLSLGQETQERDEIELLQTQFRIGNIGLR